MRILKMPTLAEFYGRRQETVICDEFQHASDEEWKFMQAIAPSAQRILLGDVNHCIYAGMQRLDLAARVAQALAPTGAKQVLLPRRASVIRAGYCPLPPRPLSSGGLATRQLVRPCAAVASSSTVLPVTPSPLRL
ncbi:MAG: hypothetical protein Q7J48_01235 [Nocardioides sp.]|nr:hypothetical protein [Nocardioides sp.]